MIDPEVNPSTANPMVPRRRPAGASSHRSPHVQSETWRIALSTHPEFMVPWSGHAFRFASPSYLRPEAILSGEGSFRFGGRWNAPGSFPAVYGSMDKVTAAMEIDAKTRYYHLEDDLRPTMLVAVKLQLQAVLDLQSTAVLDALGLTTAEIAATDWRAEQAAGREALTQALGSAALAAGAEALQVPSTQVPGAMNLVYFPGNLRPGSMAAIWHEDELRRLDRR